MDKYVKLSTSYIDIPNNIPLDYNKFISIKTEKDKHLYKEFQKKKLQVILSSNFEKSKPILRDISILNKNAIIVFSITKNQIPQNTFVLNDGNFYEFNSLDDAQKHVFNIQKIDNSTLYCGHSKELIQKMKDMELKFELEKEKYIFEIKLRDEQIKSRDEQIKSCNEKIELMKINDILKDQLLKAHKII